MLEDSISSSPSKSNKSIHETRLKRKNRRKKAEHSEQLNNDHERNVDHHRFILDFYRDSDDSIDNENNSNSTTFFNAKAPAIVSNFKPFELEKALAIADRLSTLQNNSNKPNLVPETQGFITCVNLTEMELANMSAEQLNDKNKQNSSFSITESEMINCCHQAEQNLKLTPKKDDDDMFLVNSILEDFSQSPLSKEQTKINTSWQYTPEFRLRRQPLKTYSRKFFNNTKTNLNERFEEEHLAVSGDDVDTHSSSSSLSIQEDATVGEITNNPTTIASLNNPRLCENLLNLSVYFTQNNELQESFANDSQSAHQNYVNDQDNLLFSSNIPYIINDILTLRSNCRNGKHYDSYSSVEDFVGFPSHNEDNKCNTIDVDSAEHNSIHTTLNITQDLNISNERLLDLSLNGDGKATSEDWNDEYCHDILACINTENILNQQNFEDTNLIENSNEFEVPLKTDNNEKHKVSEVQNQNESPKNIIGFKTASSKPIIVSREAHIIAAKILSKLPDIPAFEEKTEPNNCDTKHLNDVNIFENPEDYEWNDDCDLFLNFQTPIALNEKLTNASKQKNNTNEQLQQVYRPEYDVPSTSKLASIGFKTAAGKNVHISRKAQDSVQNLLKEFVNDPVDNYNCEEDLREIKSKVYAKTHKLETKQCSSNEANQSNDTASGMQKIDTKIGFQTAKGKSIKISEQAEKSVESILNEFNLDQKHSIENYLEAINHKIYKKNNESQHTMTASNGAEDETNNLISVNLTQSSNIGFQTAKGNKIITSTKAQQSVENLLEEYFDDTKKDFLSDLKSAKNDIIMKNSKGTEKILDNRENNEDLSGIMLSEWPLEKSLEIDTNENKCETITIKPYNKIKTIDEIALENSNVKQNQNTSRGFQTANGKQVSISVKAQQMVKKLLQEFHADCNIENYENDLLAIKTKIQFNNKELKPKANESFNQKSSQVDNEYALSSKNITPTHIKGKRKYSIDNSEITSPRVSISPPPKILNKGPYNSKSSLAEQSLKSPLTLASHSIISRKNLLSLTKRRKNKRNSLSIPNEEIPKINKEKYDLNQDVATPVKSSISLRTTEQTPATPNLKEFFADAPQTSTPRINQATTSQQTIMDSDFKPISWKNNESTSNSIVHTTKLSESSSANITLNSSNPTAKERIGRLKMYGKAPAVSPILIETHHNCRPSGLRRTRSMLKKSEK